MAHVVIIGAGVGGMPAAYELRAKLDAQHRITVINAVDYFQFVPSKPWLAVGWRDRAGISFPVARYLKRRNIEFVAQRVDKIDAGGNSLTLADGTSVPYDYLIITTGPKLAFDEVPGAGPAGGHSHSICTVDHAEKTWEAYQEFLKNPGPVVVGAMPMASCFGPAYEFAFILSTDLKRRKIRNKVPITFVTSEPYIGHLGLGGVGDSKSMLESEFRNNGGESLARRPEILCGWRPPDRGPIPNAIEHEIELDAVVGLGTDAAGTGTSTGHQTLLGFDGIGLWPNLRRRPDVRRNRPRFPWLGANATLHG